jgi:hypothetical protein
MKAPYRQDIPCPHCKKQVLIEARHFANIFPYTVRCQATCRCGWSYQQDFNTDEPWVPANIVRQLIHVAKAILHALDPGTIGIAPTIQKPPAPKPAPRSPGQPAPGGSAAGNDGRTA